MNHGIWFKRADVTDADPMIPALFDAVEMKPLCTRIGPGRLRGAQRVDRD